jgi:hypothetical protein
MPTYFRSDGWVKAVTGQAIPGAQVYVALQPANVAFAPPSPLASIFSDPAGLVPIAQPIITDGFGHYDFYVLPGTYTAVVALNSVIQQVYPDQSIGVAGGGGSVTSVGLTADSGSILTVSGSPITTSGTIGLSFSNESANKVLAGPASGPAATPTFRSLVLGDLPSIGFSNLTGNIAVNQMNSGTGATSSTFWRGDGSWATAGGNVFSTAGSAFFYSGQTINGVTAGNNGFASTNTANVVSYCLLNLLATYTVRQIATRVGSGSGSSTFASCAVYTSDGNTKLIDAGANAFNTQNGNTALSVTLGSPVVIGPGTYIVAWSGTANNSGSASLAHTYTSATIAQTLTPITSVAVGTAANAMSGGAMPATLGALTASSAFDLPGFIFLV